MKKFKQIFPSRNYITVDTFGETEVIFNPVGDGFEGDDKLIFRKGRWAFRVNDFLAGKTLPNGENEKMNRKVYSLGIVWDSADNEPVINTTYIDPTIVIPLDGCLVEISNTDYARETTLQSVGGHLSAINTALTTLFDVPLSTRASEATLLAISSKIDSIKGVRFVNISQFNEYEGNFKIGFTSNTSTLHGFIEGFKTSNFLFGKIQASGLFSVGDKYQFRKAHSVGRGFISGSSVWFNDVSVSIDSETGGSRQYQKLSLTLNDNECKIELF